MRDRQRSLIIVTGEEGAGKSTVMSALLPETPNAAKVDAGYPSGDTSLRDNADDYRYIAIDTTDQQLSDTLTKIKNAIPEIYS